MNHDKSPDPSSPAQPTSRAWPAILVGFVAAVAATAGIAVPLATQGTSSVAESTSAPRQVASISQSLVRGDLDDVTLGQLSEELADLGLVVEVYPETDSVEQPDQTVTQGAEDSPADEDSDDVEGDESPLGSFPVRGDMIDTDGVDPEVAAEARLIWQRFVDLVPADQRAVVSVFELMPEDYNGAHVYATGADLRTWALGVSGGPGDELDETLIHELGHLLTLQASQIDPDVDPSDCTTVFTGEGCALSGSTFSDFVSRFWPEAMIAEVDEIAESQDWEAMEDFYEAHAEDFVTDYAATNPGEDLAETIAVFVLNDRPEGDSIADQKIQLLWEDPDMVRLRDQIRAAL